MAAGPSGVRIIPPTTTAGEDTRMVEDGGFPGVVVVGIGKELLTLLEQG